MDISAKTRNTASGHGARVTLREAWYRAVYRGDGNDGEVVAVLAL